MNNAFVQKKLFWRILSAMLLFVQVFSALLFSLPAFAASAPANIISYQGRLLNANRVPVSDASASILFELYSAASGGSCVWSNSSATCATATARTVVLTDGLFSENLGDTADAVPYAAIGDAIFGNNATLYLQITINGETLTPRKQITAAPYALNAQMLDGLDADTDGATSAAIVAYNASGNLAVTGNPSGSGVGDGSLYINPASGDVSLDDTLFGIALNGTSRFRVDAEGDTSLSGGLSIAGGSLSSAASIVNLFDDATGANRIDIGGIDTDRGNIINIATNSTSSDLISLGNSHALSSLSLTGGTAWSVTGGGLATFGGGMNCTDCIDWSDFSDAATLDANTTVTLGASTLTYILSGSGSFLIDSQASGHVTTNLTGTGDWILQDNSSSFFTISDTGAYDYTLDASDNPTYTITNAGSGNIITNLTGSGDLTYQDAGVSFLTISDTGAYDFTLDSTDNPTYTITNNGTSNLITNLVGTGDFVIQDNGTTYAAFSDTGTLTFADGVVVGSSSRAGNVIENSLFSGTWGGGLGTRSVGSFDINGDYQANEAVGTDADYSALNIAAQVSNNGDINTLYGALVTATNNSFDASAIESSLFGVYGFSSNAAAVTVPVAYGLYGQVGASSGTITTGYGVYGSILSAPGSLTTGYGGFFQNITEGTTRYGVVGSASGGTNNYSGYFINGMVLVDDDTDPTNTPASNAPIGGSGDLFLRDSLEGDGSFYYGDSSGNDEFIFTSNNTAGTVFQVNANALNTNTGFDITRSGSVATDFDGILFNVSQQRNSATSDGIVFNLRNLSGGNSPAMYITQDQVADATTTPNAQALVIDVNESANNDEILLIRSDADNSSSLRDTEFRFENDGDAFADGAWTGGGADYAEFFPSADRTLNDYELVCWDVTRANHVQRCAAGDTNVIGVISTDPGFIGNGYSGADTSLENNPNYVLVGLVGQIETLASADNGAIAVGDALTTSFSRAGYAAKAMGSTYIIGRALEPLSSGTGTIKVLVQPMWYGGSMLTVNGEAQMFTQDVALRGGDATSADTAVDSAGLAFVGSAWDGSSADDVSLTLKNTVLGLGDARLSLQNTDGVDVMTFGSTGDLALAGNFYPSDRGALQYGAYVYYDSTSAGYMKTNAAGWSSASSSFAESFASSQALVPGDVVTFALDGSGVVQSSVPYSDEVVGVVSSRSAFVAGGTAGYTVAVTGRVATKVSDENGAIAVGDALTTSSRPGIAMKATTAGQILGYALESFASGEGQILAFVRPQYVGGGTSVGAPASLATNMQDVETLNVSSLLSMNGGDIVNVGTLSGIGTWEIQEDGDIVTNGQLTQVVESLQHTHVSTYATTSTETLVQLSGTSVLHGGIARIAFEDIDPNYNDIIDPDSAYRVLVTPNGVTGQLYVTDRSNAGFIIRDANGNDGVSVDWLVLAYRYDLVPQAQGASSVVSPVDDSDVLPAQDSDTPLVADPVTEEGGLVSDAPLSDPVVSADPVPENLTPEDVSVPAADPVVLSDVPSPDTSPENAP